MRATRREFVVASVAASLAGCSTNANDPSTKPTADATETRTELPEGVSLGLVNHTDSERSVTVTIRRDGDTVFDETVTVPADEPIGRTDVVTEPGEYQVTVTVDSGMTRTLTQQIPDENEMPLESYHLTIGIGADDVTFVLTHGDPAPTPPETDDRS